jgi:anti-sigma-K factor RskA
MSDDRSQTWFDQLAAYALGALEPGEAAEVEAHLAECERCQAHLRWLEPALAALPESVERLQPPKGVRDRVMAEVRADAKRAAAAESEAEGFRRRSGWLARLGSGRYGWRPAIALAAVALLVVAFVGYEVGSNDSGEGTGPLTELTQEEPSGIKVAMVSEGEGGTLKLEDVRAIPDDRVLEAWVQREGEVEAVPALFVPDHEGNASTVIEDMDGVEIVMVTHEPKGGSETPTSDPIVTMEL